VAALAAQFNHHPTIVNEYTRVRLELTTHDAGNIITELDRQLAEAIEQKWAQGSSE
jgi:4a-hydroxytetrahydrobiopterin dehydratase